MEIEFINVWFKKNEFMNVEVEFLGFCFFFVLKGELYSRTRISIKKFTMYNHLVFSHIICYPIITKIKKIYSKKYINKEKN